MGDWFQVIADVDVTPEEAADLAALTLRWLVDCGIVVAERTDCVLGGDGFGHAPGPAYVNAVAEPDPSLRDLRTNGLQIGVGKAVFYSSGDLSSITCPHCGLSRYVGEEVADDIGRWYAGDDKPYHCPQCLRITDLNDSIWEPPWAFGYLGFTFWNWPLLDDSFVDLLARRLGHRVVRPRGKV